MAFHIAKVSAIRGDDIDPVVAEKGEIEPASSKIHPSPALFDDEFQAASVNRHS
ncbi:hypothetical protein Bca4012_092594 [Brassica carinata]